MAVATLQDLSQWAVKAGNGVAQPVGGFTKELKQCRVAVVADIRGNFDGGHSPTGAPWLPLKHPRPRGGNRVLRDRGLLLASTTAAGPGHVESLTPFELIIGTNLDKAALHQYGGTIRPKGHPFLAIPVSREAERVGSPRRFPEELTYLPAKEGRSSPIFVTFVQSGRGKNKTTKTVVHYVLTPQVEVPARPFVGVSENAQQTIAMIFGNGTVERIG